ncbi:MAG: type II toxin-antitoxin system RelE/ParE family toxin [Proteobacteria bacterium]|nr:type II toxin-antitoxin system RelE/ParE family toxin [Pseudomonadota bacterium]
MTEVEYTDEFGDWWDSLTEAEQESVAHAVGLLEKKGPTLGHPYSSGVAGSKHEHMRELRVQHRGRPYRVFYAFDPRRAAILLVAGDKTGNDRFYQEMIPIADRLYDEHLAELKQDRDTDRVDK